MSKMVRISADECAIIAKWLIDNEKNLEKNGNKFIESDVIHILISGVLRDFFIDENGALLRKK